MPNPVVHFEIMGQPGPEIARFYRSLFGWPVDVGGPVRGYEQHCFVPEQGAGIAGGIGAADGSSFATIYVEVEDLDAACEHVQALGGTVVLEPMSIPEIRDLRIARFLDPAGNLIGLTERR
jgi:predicted enzyme related to lactoylglutathione lyase